VIRLGLRLSFGGGKEAIFRLVVMAFAVAIGVGLLLATLATMNALGQQNARAAWLAATPTCWSTASDASTTCGSGEIAHGHWPPPSTDSGSPSQSASGALWWLVSTDQFDKALIVRVDLASASGHPPRPPGIPRLPGPGQFYASPALSKLLRSTPTSELGHQFAGIQVGTIGPSGLASPSDLVIVIGHNASALTDVPGVGQITGFAASSGTGGPDSLGSTGLQAVLAVMALVLLFPVLVFISTATRLSAARREQRLASMRLVGATLRQITVFAAVEAVAAAAAGTVLGFALYFLAHPALAHVSLTGEPFEPGELSLSIGDALLVALGVPAAAGVAARVALRRVRFSPLGVVRRVTPPRPRALRLVPLVAGIAELAYFVAVGHPKSAGGQIQAYFLGFLLIMFGFVLAGPWLTMIGAQVMARHTRRASALIAGRRLADNPRGGFRAISGLILALFVTSVAIGTISTLLADHGATAAGGAASETVVDEFGNFYAGSVPSVPPSVLAQLRATSGVEAVTLVYTAPHGTVTDGHVPDINGIGGTIQPAVVSCSALAKTPALGRCHPGASFASVGPDLGFMPVTKSVGLAEQTTWPTAHLPGTVTGLPVQVAAVATNGSASAIERAETVLGSAFPYLSSVGLVGQVSLQDSQLLSELQTASEVVIVASLLTAGCSLAVSMVAGISDRRRPFSLLRLAGTPIGVLRRVVSIEAAAPLVVIALAASAIGLVAADLFLRSQLGISLRLPGAEYFGIVFGGLAASLAVIAITIPMIDRIAGPEVARND
jgi:hypothetical protein